MNQSVVKALGLLNFFSEEQRELTLSELSNKADMPRPTVYRLATSLEMCGFLKKTRNSDQDVRYSLGLKLLELGSMVAEQLELRKVALPFMRNLCDETNEVVHLVVRDGDEAVYVEKVEGNRSIRLYTRVGKRSELYVGSGPKLLLAYLPSEEQESIIEKMSFQVITKNTITEKNKLRSEIERIVQDGYAISEGEQDDETIGISYPIFDYTQKMVAALGVSGPSTRIYGEQKKMIQQKTKETAQKISKNLGYTKER